jgi:hypothetical protein
LFAVGVVDTATGVVDNGGNLPPVSLTPVANLPPISTTQMKLVANLPPVSLIPAMHLHLRISLQIGAGGKLIYDKTQKRKIS